MDNTPMSVYATLALDSLRSDAYIRRKFNSELQTLKRARDELDARERLDAAMKETGRD